MKYQYIIASSLLVATALIVNACKSFAPAATKAVKPFDLNRYTGKWFEIARFNYRFEKNLNNVTATYSLNDDGSVRVINRGFDYKKNKWKEARGKAKFANNKDQGNLKVSFFGPFYSGYNVIAIDNDYRYALIAGESLNYLWLLSREPSMPEAVKADYLKQAQALGYDTSKLVWVKHDNTIK